MEFHVAQAFQPAIHLPEESAGWKARPTLEIQDRLLSHKHRGLSPAVGQRDGAGEDKPRPYEHLMELKLPLGFPVIFNVQNDSQSGLL